MALFKTPAQDIALHLSSQTQLPAASVVALRVANICLAWKERSKQRTDLGKLSAHCLKDIGLTPSQAHQEANKRFWQQ